MLDDPALDGDRRGARPHDRPGGPALAHADRQRRVPEVGDARSGSRENFDVFDFHLTDDEMAAIEELDAGERIGPDPDTFVMP